jgi:replicative DNA helicase
MVQNMIHETGYGDLNLMSSELIVLGSRPAMGKTCLAVNLSYNITFPGLRVVYLSLTDPKNVIKNKLMSTVSQVDYERFIYEEFHECSGQELERIEKAQQDLGLLNYTIYDSNDLKLSQKSLLDFIDQIESDFLVLDYLQAAFVATESFKKMSMIDEFLYKLKELANQKKMCILILSQLSRKVEERTGHLPLTTDLKDCSSIEDVADKILFLRRRDYYDAMDKPGGAELFIAKDKFNKRRVIDLVFIKEYQSFANHLPIEVEL